MSDLPRAAQLRGGPGNQKYRNQIWALPLSKGGRFQTKVVVKNRRAEANLGNIRFLQSQLGQLGMAGVGLVFGRVWAGHAGARLGLQQLQEGFISMHTPIQAVEVCWTCSSTEANQLCTADHSGACLEVCANMLGLV